MLRKILFCLRLIIKIRNINININIKINKLYTNLVSIFLVYLFNNLSVINTKDFKVNYF